MARFPALISLDHMHCYRQPEVSGSEPYLWTAFFKIDGETIVVDLDAAGFFLSGPCTFVGTGGSHGNLPDTDVRQGDDVRIPAALGEYAFTVKRFRTSERLGSKRTTERGSVGIVIALIEEEQVSAAGAAAGREAFNREVEKGINEIIPTFRKDVKTEPSPDDIAALREDVFAAVETAVKNTQGFWRNLAIWLVPYFDRDRLIGADVFRAARTQEISQRFQLTTTIPQPFPRPPLRIVTHDYGLFGQIRWTIESLHVAGVTAEGGMWHALRREDEGWIGFGDVKGQAGSHPGLFEAVGCAGVNGELHMCGVTSDGGMWHTIRHELRWEPFRDVKVPAGGHPGAFEAVACAEVNGELHVCGVTRHGGMWHAIRRESDWVGFGDVKGQAGSHPGAFESVGCAEVNGELHVCGVTSDGGMWHTIRHAFRWEPFRDVKVPAGSHPGAFEAVACAEVNNELHVCGVTSDGGMWHAIRRENDWVGFGDVKAQAGGHPGRFEAISCAGANGELHVCGVTSDGGMWHAIRDENDWVGFGDVKGDGEAGGHPGRFEATAVAGII